MTSGVDFDPMHSDNTSRHAGRHFKQPSSQQMVDATVTSDVGGVVASERKPDSPAVEEAPVRGKRFKRVTTTQDGNEPQGGESSKVVVRTAEETSQLEGSSRDVSGGGSGFVVISELPETNHTGTKRRRRRKMPLPAKVAIIVVAILLVAGGGTALALRFMIDQGASAIREASNPEDIQTVEDASTDDKGLTVEYNGTTYRYNENIVSIVVMGYDRHADVSVTGAAGQADAVMVVAFDTETGGMRVIGIPRDTMVDVDEKVGDAFIGQDRMQLALSFSYGDGYGTSADNVVRAVSRILYNMPMNYFLALDMSGIGPLNDATGGVTLTPLATIPDTSIVEGVETTLYGYEAMRYVQYRDTSYLESSLDRQARQSQYLQAFFSQALSAAAGDPTVLIGLYQTALEYGFTNLGASEFAYLASLLVEHGMDSLDVTTLAGTPSKGVQYVEYELDQASVYQTVLDVFYTPVAEE